MGGICSSCLGRRKRDDSDRQHLLSPDNPYGTFDSHRLGAGGPRGIGESLDPQDVVREREALERIVTRASMNLIDIFALAPGTGTTSTVVTATTSSTQQQQQQQRQQSSRPASRNDGTSGVMPSHSHSHSHSSSGTKTPVNRFSGSSSQQMVETTNMTTAEIGNNNNNNNNNNTRGNYNANIHHHHHHHPSIDTKRMAIYRAVLGKASPPQMQAMPEVLSPGMLSEEERRWLEQIGKEADRAVGKLVEIKGVGKLVVGLELGESI